MLSYIYCYFCLLIGTHILGTANAFIYILQLLFTDWYAYTWYGKCFHIYTATFVYWLVRVYLVQKDVSKYILLLLFTDWHAYTWYGKCFHIYTATFVYWLVRVYLVRQMLSYIYCYFCLLIGTRILGTANAFIYILLLLFTDWYAYTWYGKCFHIYTATFVYWLVRVYLVRQMLSYIYCYFCLLIGTRILGTANAFIYILLLLFTDWCAYTWYGKCFHIYTATFVYWLVRVYLVRQMLSYIYCYFCLQIGTRILGTANAFIYILLLLFTDWYAYTWYGKCFHIYTATFVYLLVRIYLVRQMLSYIYCYFCLLIGTRILGTANAFIYILLLLFTDWYAYTWYGKCFHIYTATFVYWLVRVYLVRQMLSYIYCYFCLLIGTRILGTANAFIYILLLLFTDWCAYTWYGKCFHIYTATFVYWLARVYLVRQMLSYIYCYFCLLIGTRILGTANAFIYILLLLFTDWYAYTWYGKCFHIYTATFVYWLVRVYLVRQMLSIYILLLLFTDYTWYGKCFHIYTATFVYWLVRVYLVRQMLSYIYCYFCLLIGTRILGTANAFIYILLLLFTDWCAYTWYGKCFHIYTATFVYWLVRVYLVRQMLSYIYCYFCLLIGTRIFGTANAFIYIYCYFCLLSGTRILGKANAFIYILLLLFTYWCAYTWYGKCFHIYTATFIYWLVRVYLVRQMLSYIYCYFCLLIGGHIPGTANAFIYILLFLFTDWYAYTWYGKCFHIYTATFVYLLVGYIGTANAFIYILLFLFTDWWYGKCFHIYTATFIYWLVRVYLVRQMLSYIYCYFCLLIGARILSTEKCFQIYTASFVYWLVRVYLVRQMLPYVYTATFVYLLVGI